MSQPRPSRFSPRLAKILPLALCLFILPALAADQVCYDHSGIVRSKWKPCDPSLSGGSTCCDTADYCMSNGLCLNAGGNQAYSQQGCTQKDWASPACNFYCPPGAPSDGVYFLEYCWQGIGKPVTTWCCGVGCCENGTMVTIPIANQIYKAGSLQSVASTISGSASSSPSATSTASSIASGSPSAQGDNVNNNNGGGGVSTGLVLGVALGLGIPLLFVAAAFAWFYVRNQKVNDRPPASGKGDPYQVPVAGQEQGWYVPSATQQPWSQVHKQQQQQFYQDQQNREQQSAPRSELEISRPPAELDAKGKSGW